MRLQLMNQDKVLDENSGDNRVRLSYKTQYAQGNYFRLELDHSPAFVWVQLESAIAPVLLYIEQTYWDYKIPFNIQREWPYPDGAFLGKNHYSWARVATDEEINQYRNLAVNGYDQHEKSNAFPHVSANAETRNQMAFYARNAIDGIAANEKHGGYPFQSWGIDQRDDAELLLEFGHSVDLSQIKLVLRADYPHDIPWTKMTIEFSNGNSKTIYPTKTADYQTFKIDEKNITWLKLTNLIRDKTVQSFPALTEIEAWGKISNK